MTLRLACAFSVLAPIVLAPFAAHAGTWRPDPKASTLAFSGTFQGEPFDGRFKVFDATIAFDPAQLATSRFDVRVTLASADTANAERDAALRGADFFDVPRLPLATYTATRFRSLGGNRYAADGTLNLHGVAKPVTLTFAWAAGAMPALVGDASVNRLDFGIGRGQWADPSAIGNAIKVHTALKLVPSPAAAVPAPQPAKTSVPAKPAAKPAKASR